MIKFYYLSDYIFSYIDICLKKICWAGHMGIFLIFGGCRHTSSACIVAKDKKYWQLDWTIRVSPWVNFHCINPNQFQVCHIFVYIAWRIPTSRLLFLHNVASFRVNLEGKKRGKISKQMTSYFCLVATDFLFEEKFIWFYVYWSYCFEMRLTTLDFCK